MCEIQVANRSLGRSAVRAVLLEGHMDAREIADKLRWSWQRTYSVMLTVSRQENRPLMKVCKGVYKLEEI